MTFKTLTDKTVKVKLITHNDLDGVGCEIVGELAFDNLDTTIVKNPKDASAKVTEFINSKEYENFDLIFITDISVDEETADLIQDLPIMEYIKFTLLDHHGTAGYLNKYEFATVRTEGKLGKEAGTSMFFEYLVEQGFFVKDNLFDALTIFVEKVRRYDTWEWKDVYSDQEALELNNLLYLVGQRNFVSKMIHKFKTTNPFVVMDGSWRQMFDQGDKTVISVDNDKKEAYINNKEKQISSCRYSKGTFGLVFSEQYTSELGNVLSERHPNFDFIALVDMGSRKVSLRTIHDDIDLGKDVAKLFGGGGHAKASGFEFDLDVNRITAMLIFKKNESKSIRTHVLNVINSTGLVGKFTKLVDFFTKK